MSNFIINPYLISGNGLLNNLVSYYKSDTNGSFPDAHGSNTGTINGATYTASGKINGAYTYGNSKSVAIGSTGFPSGSTNRTISLWVNPTSLTGTTILFSYGTDTPGNRFTIAVTSTTIGVQINSANIYYTKSLSTSTWQHITVTLNGTTMNDIDIEVDDVLLTSVASSVNPTNTVNTTLSTAVIGANLAGTSNFVGLIDEPCIWDTNKTNDQITALYNSGSGLAYGNFTT